MWKGVLCLAVAFGGMAPLAGAQNFLDENYGFTVEEDIVYGQGAVTSPTAGNKNLLLDLYLPDGPNLPRERPAMVFVHGGLWSFGTKDALENYDGFDPGRPLDTEGVYARELAKRGYVCVSIDYRVVSDLPPGTGLFSGLSGSQTSFLVGRVQSASPSATNAQAIAAIEAAVQDVGRAVQWLRSRASQYDIDTTRIAVGGWDAGAVSSLLAAYGAGVDVAAVWSASGGLGLNDFLISPGGPAVVLFHGDSDGTFPVTHSRSLNSALDADGIPNAYYEMPGEDHYYLRDTLVDDNPAKALISVEDALVEFLHGQMNLAGLEADNAIPIPATDAMGLCVTAALMGASGLLVLQRRKRVAVRVR